MKPFIVILLTLFFSNNLLADTYPKNHNIDIQHYVFQLTLTDDSDEIHGLTEITFLLKKSGIQKLRLDFINDMDGKGMVVEEVKSKDLSLKFSHENDVLWIDLPDPSKENQLLTVSIKYRGIPATGLIIGPNKYGDRSFFSDNWPNKARNWLPVVDHPYDKATGEFIVTAPAHYQVISNGLKLEESNLDAKNKITHWKQSVPISIWLYALGVAEFAVQYVDEFEGKSIQTWVYKQDRDAGFYDFAIPTKEVMQFYTDYVGPFAYEKLANVQANSVGGGMESATNIFYGDNSVSGKRNVRWRNIIIHEVAHQWFGNAVTESEWDDVWLSEGFATYFTLVFREYAYGREDFVEGLKSSRDRVFAYYKDNKDYKIVHDNLSDMNRVTSSQTYQKGGWTLHMLRNLIGEEAFQKGIKSYYRQYKNANCTTGDFKRHMEEASGRDLELFFHQWLYQGGNVVLDGNWNYNLKKKVIVVKLDQVQNDGFKFEFPLEIGIYGEGKNEPEIKSVNINSLKNTFEIPFDFSPNKIELDPKTVLLAQWNFSSVK